ncbi:MAG: RIP metalloprotease RseP [Campylobacterales bacterium]|nr:RIP metalloprotease RseP [Campylobacterales bacterium]
MSLIVSLLVISFLIFFHELGHYLAARAMNVKVLVFSIGFGKKLLSKRIGDTQWSISAIPLGGYVQMKGQDDSDPTKVSYDEDSYTSKTPLQKIFILVAGPFANFLLAFMLYLAMTDLGIPKPLPIVGEVSKDSPALQAGLQKGDKIVQIDNRPITYWEDIGQTIETANDTMRFTVEREGRLMDLTLRSKVITDQNLYGEPIQRKIVGIVFSGDTTIVHYGFVESIEYAWDKTLWASMFIFESLKKLITGVVGLDKLGGVITIVDVTAKASAMGLLSLLSFAALVSVNLGVLNLLPIPALDGGHIMFNLYEMVTKKAPSIEMMVRFTVVGWMILISLMFIGLFNDINRLMGG